MQSLILGSLVTIFARFRTRCAVSVTPPLTIGRHSTGAPHFRTASLFSVGAVLGLTVTVGEISGQTPLPGDPTPQSRAPAAALPQASSRKPAPTLTSPAPLADGEVSHVVKEGDTLWDIAKAYLKDPFRWPEVFQRNTDVVENPHWIYPGEVIRIANGEVRPEVLAELAAKPVAAPRPATLFDQTVFSNLPARLGDRTRSNGQVLGRDGAPAVRLGEVDAAPFVDRQGGPAGAGRLAAAYDRLGIVAKASDQRFQLEDPIFVEVPSGRLAQPGDLYLAYVMGPQIDDDAQIMVPTAIVRIENVMPGELSVARIIRQFGEIRVDQALIPLESAVPATGRRPVAVTDGATAHVLWVHETPVLPSLQSYVVLSREQGAPVSVGDQFTLIDATVDASHPAPPVPAAIVQVLRVTPHAITAIVIDHNQPTIRAGMPARVTARMM